MLNILKPKLLQMEIYCHFVAARPGATEGHSGAVPPQMTACAPQNENCAPPGRELCPKEINRLGATGVQMVFT